jgi:hypothetical protein
VTSCNHKNPLGFAFCVTCGEQLSALRCPRCGFACDQRFIFCGGCGCDLRMGNGVVESLERSVRQQMRYDLNELMAQYELGSAPPGSNGKVNQDDIRAMLEIMQKK